MGKRPPFGAPPSRDFRDESRRDPFNPFGARPNSRPTSRPGSQPGSREGSRTRDPQIQNLVAGDRSRGNSPFRGSPTPPLSRGSMEAPSKPSPPTKQLTNAEIEKKVKSLMDELISVQDSREAIACVEELKCGEKMSHVVEELKCGEKMS